MGRIKIRLTGNPKTGQKDLVIEYESDPDRTLVEHERRHRQIVEQLVGQGVLRREELGDIRVERKASEEPAHEEEPEAESLSEGS